MRCGDDKTFKILKMSNIPFLKYYKISKKKMKPAITKLERFEGVFNNMTLRMKARSSIPRTWKNNRKKIQSQEHNLLFTIPTALTGLCLTTYLLWNRVISSLIEYIYKSLWSLKNLEKLEIFLTSKSAITWVCIQYRT